MGLMMPRFLYWSPRILCIAFALLLSVFAADVFGENQGLWATTTALFMHLIPMFIVLLVLALAWRHELLGAGVFFALGVLYVMTAWGRFHWSASAVIGGPLLLISALFVWSWWVRVVADSHPAQR